MLLTVFVVFFGDAYIQTTLPSLLDATTHWSSSTVGVFVACSLGAGVLLAAPIAALSDARGRRKPLAVLVLLTAVSIASFGIIDVANIDPAFLCIPIVLFGLVRFGLTVVVLALVSTTVNLIKNQGLNGGLQRLSSILAALIAALAIAYGLWSIPYLAIAVVLIAFLPLMMASEPPGSMDPRTPVHLGRSYRTSFSLLRSKDLQVASMLAGVIVTVVVVGSGFYPLALDLDPDAVGLALFTFLVARDLSAVAFGFAYPGVVKLWGLGAMLVIIIGGSLGGFVALFFAPTSPTATIIAGILHGLALTAGIGTYNLMAVRASGPEGAGMKLVSANYPGFVISLVIPIPLGVLAYEHGVVGIGLLGIIVCAALSCAALIRLKVK